MRKQLLFIFSVLALFQSGFTKPGRLRRDTEDMRLGTAEIRSLMGLFSEKVLQLTRENTPKLMTLMHMGRLSEDQVMRLAAALIDSSADTVTAVKRKLNAGEELTREELPIGWALSVTVEAEKAYTEAEKAEYERQRAKRLSEIDLEDVSDAALSELVKKLGDDSQTTPTEEEQRTLIQEADRLTRVEAANLAKLIAVTEDEKSSLLNMLTARNLLGEEDAKRFWALKQKGEVPKGTVPTPEKLLEDAKTLLLKLDSDGKVALLAKLVDPEVKTLTDAELDQLVAMEKMMDFTMEQREALAGILLAKITDEMYAKIKIAIIYKDDRPIVMKYIPALIKAGKLSSKVLRRMMGEGIMPNGETIGDAFKRGTEIPDSLGLTPEQKAIVKEIGNTFNGTLNFDNLKGDDMEEIIEAYEKMSEENRNLVAKLESMASNLTDKQIRMLEPHILDKIPTETLEKAYEAMDESMRKVFCSLGVRGREGEELYQKLQDICKYDLRAEVEDLEEGERKRLINRVLKAKGDKAEIKGEDLDELATNNLIDREVLDRVPPEELKENEKAIAAAVANGEGKHVAARLRKAKGGVSNITEEEFKKMKGVELKPSDIRDMDKDVVAKGVEEFLNGLKEGDGATRTEIAKKIKEAMPEDRNTADDDVLANYVQAGMSEVLDELTSDEKKKEVIKKLSERKLTEKATTKAVKTIESMEEFRNPTEITKEKLTKMKEDFGQFITKLSRSFVKEISKDVIKESLKEGLTEDIESMDKATAREYAKAAKDLDLNKENLKNIGPAVFSALPREAVEGITAETAKDPEVVRMVKDAAKNMDPVIRKTFLSKINLGTDVSLCAIGGLCEDVSLETAKGWDDDVIQDILDNDCDLDCKPAIMSLLASKMVALLGDPKTYTQEMRSRLLPLIVQLPVDVISELPVDQDNVGQTAKMLRDENLNEKKRESLMKKMKAMYEKNKPTSESEVADMAPALEIFDEESLNDNIDERFCGEAVEGLSKMDMENVDKKRLKGMTRWAIKCKTGSTSGAIDSEAATALEGLICYMPTDRVPDLTESAVDDTIDDLKKCPYDEEDIAVYKKKVMDRMPPPAEMTEEDVAKISSFLAEMEPSEIDKIKTGALSENLEEVTTAQETRLETLDERQSRLGEDANLEVIQEEEVKVAKKLIQARIKELQAARKKRSTESPMECSDVKDTGKMAIAFTPEELTNLKDQVILDCLTTLGGDIDWSMEQKTALANRLKAEGIHGPDLTQWSSAQIVDAGTMMGGFTEEELGQFPWGIDELASHGTPPANWTPDQLAAVAGKWMSSVKSGDASKITALELSVLGHFACGLTVAQINQIPNSVYQEAVADVGEAEGCSSEQATAFATKAKAVYNKVNTWSTDIILSVNRVLAGLSGTEFSSMSSNNLGEIHPHVIAILPADTLSGLTGEQIMALTKSQANAVTEDQFMAFNPSQREALQSIIGNKFTSDNSAGVQQMSVISGILVTLVTIALL